VIDCYDPWDAAVHADPWPHYRWLRDEQPCYRNDDLDIYVLSRHGDVSAALRDHTTFISADGVSRWVRHDLTVLGDDPPRHTQTRRVGSRAFTRPAMANYHEEMARLAATVVGTALEREAVDAMADIADPLATTGLASVLGISELAHPPMIASSRGVFDSISAREEADQPGDWMDRLLPIGAEIDAIIEARREAGTIGRGDVIDSVIAHGEANDDGFRLSRFDRAVYVTSLIGPGLGTTRHLIGSGIEAIAKFPDAWQQVRTGAVDAALFVEETLRFEAPIQGFFRGTSAKASVAGTDIPAGSRVLMLYGSANRDERVYSRPDVFDPARPEHDHLAFGSGAHFCMGAGLARLEATMLFREMAQHVAAIELTGEGGRAQAVLLRGWESLPVRLVAG
jgi:cytochrome P450